MRQRTKALKNNWLLLLLFFMLRNLKSNICWWIWWKQRMVLLLGSMPKLSKVFNELNIPMANIVGYSSDTTNVMFGKYNFISELPHVQIVKCSCRLILR